MENKKLIIFIIPRLLFSKDGVHILPNSESKNIDRKFRKPFVKNDFLRRRFLVWYSFITHQVKTKQLKLFQSIKKINPFSGQININKVQIKFNESKLIKFGSPIEILANFKPNNEFKKEKKIITELISI